MTYCYSCQQPLQHSNWLQRKAIQRSRTFASPASARAQMRRRLPLSEAGDETRLYLQSVVVMASAQRQLSSRARDNCVPNGSVWRRWKIVVELSSMFVPARARVMTL